MNVLQGDTVAQLAHVGWGAAMTFALSILGCPWAVSAVIVAALAAAKESSEATGVAFWEPKQSWLSSAIDWIYFLIGIGLAEGIHWISKVLN